MEDITDAGYGLKKRVCKLLGILWFVFSRQYIIVSWYVWELLSYMSWNI